jgi:hypothetical protein
MKPKQVIILTVAAMAFAVLFAIRQNWMPWRTEQPVKGPEGLKLNFESVGPQVAELTAEGHYNFHFQNTHTVPVTFGVLKKNCNCASVQVCIMPEDWKDLKTEELAERAEEPALNWKQMELDGPGFEVPAGAAGWVRVNWPANAGELGAKLYKAELWMQKPDRGAPMTLEVPVTFVLPVIVREATKMEDDVYKDIILDTGDQRMVDFIVFSHTRAHFKLTPAPTREDPCIVYHEPTALPKERLEQLTLAQAGKPVKVGYHVRLTIHEHVGDRQLDLGAFRRTVAWTSEVAPALPIEGKLRGIVLGEVRGPPSWYEAKQFPGINFETVRPDGRDEKEVVLESRDPDPSLQLTLDRTVDFLDVKLAEGKDSEGRKTWTVSAKFKKDSPFRGPFPDPPRVKYEDCAVVFLVTHKGVQGEEPKRRIRIPVRGTVQGSVR